MVSNFVRQDSEYESILSINKKVEIVKEDALKYNAIIASKQRNDIMLSMGDVYHELIIKRGEKLKYFLGKDDLYNQFFYSCNSNVLQVDHYENKIFIQVTYPNNIESLGIRKFFRMKLEMPIFYNLINYYDHYEDVDDVPGKKFVHMVNALMLDLSGSGAKIVVETFCRKGQQVAIVIPDLNYMKLLGTIEWLEPDKFNQNTKLSISFKNIKPTQQDKIILHIFSQTVK